MAKHSSNAFLISKAQQIAVLSMFMLLNGWGANGQSFRNLDFKDKCDSARTGLCFWEQSWGAKQCCRPGSKDEKSCLTIQGKYENSVGFAEQSLTIESTKEVQILQLSAMIYTEGVSGQGAGLNVGMYDGAGNLAATKDMGGRYSVNWAKGNTAWHKAVISAVCPTGVVKIKIGAILYGKGQAGFADYHFLRIPLAGRTPSALALRLISAACDTIAAHSLYRDAADLPSIKQTALKIAGPAKHYAECYPAIQFILESLRPLGDEHSFFMTAADVRNWESDGTAQAGIKYPKASIAAGCGYILVPPFHGGNKPLMQAYADTLQQEISWLEKAGIKGWIIDLRGNTGGNMEPMIAGLGPLFDTGKLGALIDVDGKSESWSYRCGAYYWESEEKMRLSHPVTLGGKLPIAVLTDAQTGSSGEAVATSFVGNSRTRSFGQSTWGLTTGNGGYDLEDGSRIMLASTRMADRTGKAFSGRIVPDVEVVESGEGETDLTLQGAIHWIINGG